ncbi:TPA: hypothetical protein EYG96_01890, partial [Candidatus Gracilibacteria bacterium]|nr:hypothetical protein [Candidatus Gracilibacteria bacterium]
KFTTHEGIRANILNPVDMTVSAGAQYEQALGNTGLSAIMGVGVSANAEKASIMHNHSYGLKYENGPLQMSLQKNIQYFDTITGAQDIASYNAKASLDVGQVNLFVSAQAGDDKDITSVSAGIEKNSEYYTNKLTEIYQSVVLNETEQILTDLNARRAQMGKPPVGENSMLLQELQMAKAGSNLIAAMRGSLHNIGLTLSAKGLSILMGFVTDITVFKRVTGLDTRQFAKVESLIFQNIQNQNNVQGRLTAQITLSEIKRSATDKKLEGEYNPYPASIAKKHVGISAGSAYSSPKIIIHGEKNIKIHEDGSMSFLPGVVPHPPLVSERTMADGTTQIEINYGNNYLSSSIAYTEEIIGEFTLDGSFRKLELKKLNAEELEYNQKILAELKERGHVKTNEVIMMRGLTKEVLLEQNPERKTRVLTSPASTKIVKLTDGKTTRITIPATYEYYDDESVESLAISPEKQYQVMSDINALTLQLLKNKKLSTWSTELENYFTKNLQIRDFTNPTKREEIRRYVKAKFQEKHTPLARTLEEKPLLIYLAIERARMQRDNRNYDKNGNFISFKKTAEQKEAYAQKGDFNTVLTKEFGNKNGGKFQLGTETISFTDGDI